MSNVWEDIKKSVSEWGVVASEKAEEFTHRNGRTARMNSEGTAYVLQWKEEYLPECITAKQIITPEVNVPKLASTWATLFISGGRKDKISKGVIFSKGKSLNSLYLFLIIKLSVLLFVLVLFPFVETPHGVTGWRPPEVLPSPPPCG